jgi:sugar phosphate isomerase/epimerase
MRLGLECGSHTLDMAVELGIRGVPIDAQALVDQGVEATLKSLQERGLVVCQIGAFGFNVLSTDRARQASQHTLVEHAIPLAADTGCPYIVICGGNYHPTGFLGTDVRNFSQTAIDEIARGLTPLLKLAERHHVKLSIEPYLKTAINSPEAFLQLCEKVDSEALKVNIDVTSFYRYDDMLDPNQTIRNVCNRLSAHYGLAHIKELALADDFHIHIGLAPFGSGITPWGEVLRSIEPHLPDDSWLILEHVATPDEARNGARLLREIAAQARVLLT